jgi:hypothetical protein
MKPQHRSVWAIPLVAAALLSACGEAPEEEHVIDEPLTLEEVVVEGTELTRITLAASAAERLGIETAPVARADGQVVVPAAAVFVDPEGVFWVYTNPEPLVFIRHEISIANERGARTFLSSGPSPGTDVVTVGVPELYGAELEIGH